MNAPAPSYSDYLEWFALRSAIQLIAQGNMATTFRRSRWLSRLGKHILRSEWHWANTNLAMIYGPQLTPEARHKLAKLAFENIFASHLEALRTDDVQFEDHGIHHLQEAYQMGRGVILCGVHIGSWEPGIRRAVNHALPLAVVYRHANNPLSEKVFMDIRSHYGIQWIRRQDARSALTVLQEKKILGLMIDINTREGGVTAPFLGMPAQCPVGPARLAMRFQCPIVVMAGIRTGPGQGMLLAKEPLLPPHPRDPAAIPMLTARINHLFADWIHEYAEQYNWLHARWRSRPDGTLWRADHPLEALWAARVEPHPPLSARVRALIGL